MKTKISKRKETRERQGRCAQTRGKVELFVRMRTQIRNIWKEVLTAGGEREESQDSKQSS